MKDDLVLVDSSIWVSVFRRDCREKIKKDVEALLENERIATNPIILTEILQGCRNNQEFEELFSMFSALRLVEFTEDFWEKCYKTAYELRRKGLNFPVPDIIIASSAIHYNLLLLHADSHFEEMRRVESRLRTKSYLYSGQS